MFSRIRPGAIVAAVAVIHTMTGAARTIGASSEMNAAAVANSRHRVTFRCTMGPMMARNAMAGPMMFKMSTFSRSIALFAPLRMND